MSKISFENYGKLARELEDSTVIAGRHAVQADAERGILPDVMRKLQIEAGDRVLDIGCNAGNLLIPLSFLVREITGIDHASCIEKLNQRFTAANARLIAGNFLEILIDGSYEKILCYSVLHYLSGKAEVFQLISQTLALLSPGGRALFGDIPNKSKKARFLNSPAGKEFEQQWQELVKSQNRGSKIELAEDPKLVSFDDEFLLEICRKYRAEGFEAYLTPQPGSLPFGNTREDLVIARLK